MNGKGRKTWVKTRTPLLWKHAPTGVFYARVKVAGKDIWKTIDTDILSVAQYRLPDVVARIKGARNRSVSPTVRQALGDAVTDKAGDPELEQNTKDYYRTTAGTILRTFPDPDMHADRVTDADMEQWRREHAKVYAPSSTNGALVLWKFVFQRLVKGGFVASDPSAGLKRRKVEQVRYDIPTVEDFARIVADIEGQRKANSRAASFAVRFMAFTGLRKGDARAVRWKDIDSTAITFRIEKNNTLHRIPLIPSALELLDEIRQVQKHRPDDPVITCLPHEALKNACKRLELPHLRLHDLRHIFATRCLESGVDIPTVSKWMGHKDGGVLAAKIYGHLTDDHSATQAARVRA